MKRFSEPEFLESIETHKITETAVVPPLIVKFLSGDVEQKRRQLSSLRVILCAGAHLDASIQEKANRELLDPQARIAQVWGMTECGWISTFFHPEKDETGSVGRPMPGYQCRSVIRIGESSLGFQINNKQTCRCRWSNSFRWPGAGRNLRQEPSHDVEIP